MNAVIKTDEICTDPHIVDLKRKQMRKFKRYSLLNSIATTCMFVAAPIFGMGIGAAIGAGGTLAFGTLSMALLGSALALLLTGVASSYSASRIWTDGQFNKYEISAQSTARHLVQEIKANNMCFEHERPVRADGKTWAQAVEASREAQQRQSL